MPHHARPVPSRRNAGRIEKERPPHPLGDERGALAQPPVLRRPGGGREEHGGHAHQPPQRQALGLRHRTSGARGGESGDHLCPGLGAEPAPDPPVDPHGGGTEDRHRGGGDRKSKRLNSSHRCLHSFPTRRSSDLVNPETTYAQAWERSQRQIRLLIPMAAELKIVIGVEEVGNKFLLSPLEFARYVDDFASPWIRAYFDVGNIMSYAYPQDWIRTLGKRIVKVHIKDWANRMDPTIKKRVPEYVALLEGEIDWKAVHQALADIDYRGTATLELAGGDAEYIKEVSRRFDRILDGV